MAILCVSIYIPVAWIMIQESAHYFGDPSSTACSLTRIWDWWSLGWGGGFYGSLRKKGRKKEYHHNKKKRKKIVHTLHKICNNGKK